MPSLSGAALLCCLVKALGPLSRVPQPVRGRYSSSVFMTSGPALPPAISIWGRYLSLTHTTIQQMKGGARSSKLMLLVLGPVYPHPSQQSPLYCAVEGRCRACFPECCSSSGSVGSLGCHTGRGGGATFFIFSTICSGVTVPTSIINKKKNALQANLMEAVPQPRFHFLS